MKLLARSDALSERLRTEAGEILAAHLESLYPPAIMQVLAQYGCTLTRNEAHIQVRLPESDRWSEHINVALPRVVIVASSYHGLFCGGPWFSTMPNRGVNAETMEQIKAGTHECIKSWEEFVADQDDKERRRVPEILEPLFFELVSTRFQYKAQYHQLTTWPHEQRSANGVYPTWQQITGQFPVAGAYIQRAETLL